MRKIFWLAQFTVLVLSGCMATARFYPVRGPLASQAPLPVLVGKITGAFNSGTVTVKLKDGEVCKGRWATVGRPESTQAANQAATPDDMASVWDAVYGQGFYVSHVLGARLYARAVLAGDRGTTLNFEMYKHEDNRTDDPAGAGAIKGVAKDNSDNIYKVTFGG